MTPRVHAIFCDDIRVETSGKLLVIGAYTSDLIARSLPTDLTLTIWVRVYGLPEGVHKNTLALTLNGEEVFSADGELVMGKDMFVVEAVAHAAFEAKGPGELAAWLHFPGEEPSLAGSLRISAAETPPEDE
jgi:hypothetical protein